MDFAKSQKFLSEKQKLQDLFDKLEIDLNNCLENFENLEKDKINELYDLITDNEPLALVINGKFYKDFSNFKNRFERFFSSFEETRRSKMEITLENFLDDLQILKKDLFA
ncbi:MAG: hypothetical protein WCT85_04960 [Parachlamydiales bacterium]|jgi:hypothetical protein